MSDLKKYGAYHAEGERLDAILSSVAEIIEREESGVSFVNEERIREFYTCGELIRYVMGGDGIDISVIAHDKFASVGTIRVLGKRFSIRDTQLFAKALRMASNYEIYPKLDGTLVLALTFYGLTDKAGV